ncbi:MAG: hypothetical protein R3E83_17590 [Burkholderiaceae bacterium]
MDTILSGRRLAEAFEAQMIGHEGDAACIDLFALIEEFEPGFAVLTP